MSNQDGHKAIPIIEKQGRALMQAVPDLVFLLGLAGCIDLQRSTSDPWHTEQLIK